MVSAGQQQILGPFIGGLNTRGDPSAIADNELVVLENMEVDLDGGLRVRPQIVPVSGGFLLPSGPVDIGKEARPLGFFTINGLQAFYAQTDGGTYRFYGGSWTLVTTMRATCAVSFLGKLHLVADPDSGTFGGTYDGTTFTVDTNMPRGYTAAVYKGLIYIGTNREGTPSVAKQSRLYRSNPADVALWPGTPIDIGYGDGENVVALYPWQGQLLVFRSNSIWSYSWSGNPAAFVSQPIDSTVGASNMYSIDALDGVIYFMYGARAYSFINGRATQINENVPFSQVGSSHTNALFDSVSTLNGRVIFSYLDTLFVYSTDTFTWSRWTRLGGNFGKLYTYPGQDVTAVGFNRENFSSRELLTIADDFYGGNGEPITATMRTKTFDFGTPSQYKRLFWWGANVGFQANITGSVTPVAYPQSGGGSQIGTPISVTIAPQFPFTTPQQDFIKFPKSLRFRGVYFELSFTVTRSIYVGVPTAKVFTISTFVRVGERAVERIT